MKKFVTAFIALFTALSICAMLPACDFGGDNSTDSDPTQNGDNTANNGNQNDEDNTDNDSDEPVTQYSGILNAVLNSDYYNDIIYAFDTEYKFRSTNLESPIPYTFLEREGYDIEAIKNDKLSCETVAYIMDGDTTRLYISTHPESPAGYYGNYILSYPLTQQEYEDLYMLHREEYIQAGLFIQELDAQKRATVESHINVEIETYEGMETKIKRYAQEYTGLRYATIDVVYANEESEFTLHVRMKQSGGGDILSQTGLYIAECYMPHAYTNYDNHILYISDYNRIYIDNEEQFQNKTHDLTYFDSQGKTFLRHDI